MVYPKLSDKQIIERLQPPVKNKRYDVVIDTDACNTVDDQFAISWLLQSQERIQVEAVYAVPFSHHVFESLLREKPDQRIAYLNAAEDAGDGMRKSYEEIKRIFRLLDRQDTSAVLRGSERYLPDRTTPVISDAARDLAKRAMDREDTDPLYVVAIGAITNIASAILLEPEIIRKIVLVWLAGEPLSFPNGCDYNLGQDVYAAQIIFESGVPLVLVPNAGVSFTLTVSLEEVERYLGNRNRICDYLTNMLRASAKKSLMDADPVGVSMYYMRRFFLPAMNDMEEQVFEAIPTVKIAWSQRICDLAAAAWMIHPGWTLSRIVSAPKISDTMDYDWSGETHHPMREITYISRDAVFGDLFCKLGKNDV